MIYQFYHGDAAAGIPSRVNMLVHGEDIYVDLYDTKVDVVTDDDDDRPTPTKRCLKREYHHSNRNFIAGSDITVLALERNVFTKNSTLVTGQTLWSSGNGAHANVKKAFSHALTLIKQDGSPKESGDKRPDLEKKVLTNSNVSTPSLDQEKNQRKKKLLMKPRLRPATRKVHLVKDSTRSIGFSMDGTLSCYMDHLPLQTSKTTSSN
jgi:hypothetical protein